MFKTVKNVVKHSIIYGIGDLLTKLLGFILIPVYTRYLSPAQYGMLELLQLTSYVISLMIALGIAQAVVRFYFDFEREEDQLQVVSVALIAVWAAAAAGFALCSVFARPISSLVFEDPSFYSLFYLVFATVALTVTAEIPLDYLRIKQRSVLYATISIARVALTLLLNIFFLVYRGMGVEGVLLSGVIAQALSGLFLLIYLLRRIELTFSVPLFLRMLRYGVPLIGSWASGFVMHFFDRFLLQRLTSLGELGIYALGYKFGFLLNALLLSPFQRSWGPIRFEIAESAEGPKTFSLVFTYYCALQLYLTLGICATIDEVMALAAGPEFRSAAAFVPLLLAAYNFFGVFAFFEFGLLQAKKTGLHAAINLAACLVNVAMNLLLIPRWGAWGAAWATVITFVVLAGLTFWQSQRLYFISVEWGRLAKVAALSAALYAITLGVSAENPWQGLLLKGGIAALLPLLLLPFSFYYPEELARAKEILLRRNRPQPAEPDVQNPQS